MDELIDKLQEIVYQLQDLNRTLERMDDGLFSLSLHVGADVSAWTGNSGAAGVPSPAGQRTQSQGVVKWYDTAKGFGFIAQTGGGPDVFVHSSVVPPPGFLNDGQRVVFEMVEGTHGPMATSLQVG